MCNKGITTQGVDIIFYKNNRIITQYFIGTVCRNCSIFRMHFSFTINLLPKILQVDGWCDIWLDLHFQAIQIYFANNLWVLINGFFCKPCIFFFYFSDTFKIFFFCWILCTNFIVFLKFFKEKPLRLDNR